MSKKKAKTTKKKPKSASKALVVSSSPKSTLAIIAEAVASPKVDVAKMQALLDMQRQLQADQARIDFTEAFQRLQRELPTIRPDGKIEIRAKDNEGKRTGNIQQATPYATFPNIMKVCKPLLDKHGFTLSFATEPTPDGSRIIVKGFLDHISGHQRTTSFPLPAETSGSKNNVQGWGSAMSYGKRYATTALLNIVSDAKEDRDLDGAASKLKGNTAAQIIQDDPHAIDGEVLPPSGPALISVAQHDTLVDALESAGVTRKKFCEVYKVEKIADLPASMYDTAMKACRDFMQKKKAVA